MIFNILLQKFKIEIAVIAIKLEKPLISAVFSLISYYFIKYINQLVKYKIFIYKARGCTDSIYTLILIKILKL